ncbi:MAG TPA: hypothetical protein VMJ12_09410 [Candidatus Acidoferrales bacterium]|nr:hypothetical protein [Candidatus Acidoferrales bacterium]
MNLGKLLAAGKSIIGGRGEISYRIRNRGYLPKFISAKNPFAPPVKVEPAPNAATPPNKKSVAFEGTKTQKLPALAKASLRKSIWAGKFNPLSLWRGSHPATPPRAQGPLQAELSLDRVKVVHNDLTDAEVEIVPIKSRTAPEPEAPILPPTRAGDSWSRLSAKIFGAKAA